MIAFKMPSKDKVLMLCTETSLCTHYSVIFRVEQKMTKKVIQSLVS